MERSPMLVDCQNQYYKNDCTTKRFNVIPIKIPDILNRDRNINPKVHMESQKTSNSQSNSEQKENAGGITISTFKLHYRAIAVKTVWYWDKNRHKD
jgi:hypothetical protein